MKVKTLVAVLVVIFAMTLIVGCAKVPQQELDAAKAAVDAAKAIEADRYAPELYNAVKDSLNAVTAEIEKQNSKFALFRSYSKAKTMLAAALTAANTAKETAVANKEKVKLEAADLLAKIGPAVDDVKKVMKKAPRGKEGKAALEAMSADLTAVEAAVAEANTAVANGDYLTARDKAQASLQKVASINEELQQAIAKKKGGKK
jgi:hypothetical protein